MGILLTVVAYIMALILFIPCLIYSLFRYKSIKEMSDHYLEIATAIDRLGNVVLQYPMNDTMVKKGGEKYGNGKETISGVTGKNYRGKTQTYFGKLISWGLDDIQRDHVTISIDDTQTDEIK